MSDKPMLIEANIKHTLANTLHHCHMFKLQHYNFLFNIGILILFFIILSLILLVKYRGKPTEKERLEKEYRKKEYILSRIQNFQESRNKLSQTLITGLPSW
jgi:hypothetical protein